MKLNDLREVIASSTVDDWNVFHSIDGLVDLVEDPEAVTEAMSGGYVAGASYVRDLDLTVMFGEVVEFEGIELPDRDKNIHAWSQVFDSPAVTDCVADVLWRGAHVDSVTYAIVDRGAAVVPAPPGDGQELTPPYRVAIARLIHTFQQCRGDFDDYVDRAGLVVG